jgi:hypothetical protein
MKLRTQKRNEMHTNYQSLHGDGLGDGGERFRIVATSLVERGWTEAEIKQEIAAQYWRFAIPVDWDAARLQEEIERVILKVRPLETKPAAQAWGSTVSRAVLPVTPSVTSRVTQAWVPLRSTDEAAPNATQSNAAADVEVAVQTNVADVAASDLRAAQRAIASGRWRENSQAKQWAGHAVAAAMKLDVETHKAKIVALLKTWIGNGALVVVEGEDEQRKKRRFVEVASMAE